MLNDKDRIFLNLYNDKGSDVVSAQSRGDWSNTKDLIDIINIIDQIPIGKSVSDFVMKLVRNLRPESSKFDYIKKYIQWGPGPRGGLALLNVIKARALIKKKLSPTVSDIINFAQPTLRHRISLNFEARADLIKIDQMIKKVCEDLD